MRKLITGMLLMMAASLANAGLMCADRYANNTIQNLGCELGSTNNDSQSQVNLDLMFGYDDWLYAWKDDSGDAMPDGLVDYSISGSLLSGAFQIDWADETDGQVLFVLKDGAGDPDTYVGWLLDAGDFGIQDYAFNTPFITDSENLKQISHASFYYRNGGPTTRQCVDCATVPEPGTAMLFGLGAAGLIASRKRKVS